MNRNKFITGPTRADQKAVEEKAKKVAAAKKSKAAKIAEEKSRRLVANDIKKLKAAGKLPRPSSEKMTLKKSAQPMGLSYGGCGASRSGGCGA